MRRVLSLLAASLLFGHNDAFTVVTVYRNVGPNGTCECTALDAGFGYGTSPTGVETVVSQATTANGNAASGGSQSSSGQSSASGGNAGATTMSFITPYTTVFTNAQTWFGTVIQGAFNAATYSIGSGGVDIDYTAVDAHFPHIGPALKPDATVYVQTIFTTVINTMTTVKSVTASQSQFGSSQSSPSVSSISGPLFNAATSSSSNSPTTVGAITSSASATPTSLGQAVMLVANGDEFGCRNGSLVLLPTGETGDIIIIGNDGTLSCGVETAYVQPQSNTQRRSLAGRAVSNSTAYEIDLFLTGTGPSTATSNGFSILDGYLKLLVHEIQLEFALLGSILEAYNPALGLPAGASSVAIGGTPVAASSTSSLSTGTASAATVSANTATSLVSSVSTVTSTSSGHNGIASTSKSASSTSSTASISKSASSGTTLSSIVTSRTGASSSVTGSATTSSVPGYLGTFVASASSSSASASATATAEVVSGCSLTYQSKNVFAHMIVGNLYNYDQADFLNDFKIAASYGIDAMALNVGRDSWQLATTALAYQAAQQLFTEYAICFKVFVSLDMSSFSSAYAPDGSYVSPYVSNFKSNPAQFYYKNRHFVSTYGGYEQFNWTTTFIEPLAEQGIDVYFVPAYSIQTYAAAAYATTESDGQFLWNAWPNDPATGAPTDTSISPMLAEEYVASKGSKTLMLNISPWFFTHFSNDVKNMNFHSEGLWQQRWTQMLSDDLYSGVDFLEITSWNDYGESHYIGPIGASEPDVSYPEDTEGVSCLEWVEVDDHAVGAASDEEYVDHTAFADQAIAWITGFHTGTFPTITAFTGTLTGDSTTDAALLATYQQDPNADRMYVSYRMQYNDSTTSEPASREPTGSAYAQNVITIDSYLSQSGTLYVNWPALSDTNGTQLQTNSQDAFAIASGNSQTFAPFLNPDTNTRRYGTPTIYLETDSNQYELQMGTLWPIMTPDIALTSTINFNAYTKKFTQYTSLVT